MKRLWLIIALCLVPLVSLANAPSKSVRPDARPGSQVMTMVKPTTPASNTSNVMRRSPVPILRPRAAVVETPQVNVVLATAGAAVRLSPRPNKRPRNLKPHRETVQTIAVARTPTKPVATSRRGSVCGDKTIRGQTLSPIAGRLRGCGVKNPVKVTSVDGVTLTQPATVNCETAKALKRWVSRSVKPAVGRLGGGVKSLRVVAHYSCRTRNNQPGAKISEHGRGNAVDIAAINLNNGSSISVLKGWRDPLQGKVLKRVHKEACGTFGTVLGPNSDRFHQDHFHFDVARHRGGAYCR